MNALLIFFDFIGWWYTKGFILLLKNETAIFKYLLGIFSVKESLLNLFAPWKRLVSARKPGLDGLKDWLIDSLISRGVGFTMRLILLGFFLISLAVYFIIATLFIIFWLAWPAIIIILISWGISNV